MSGYDKLDSRAKQLLAARPQSGEADAASTVGALIQVKPGFNAEQRAKLEDDGAKIRTVAGDVLTADVPVGSLERISENPFVLIIQVSQPLYPEEPDLSGSYYSDVE